MSLTQKKKKNSINVTITVEVYVTVRCLHCSTVNLTYLIDRNFLLNYDEDFFFFFLSLLNFAFSKKKDLALLISLHYLAKSIR